MKKAIPLILALVLCLVLAGCDSSQYKKATNLYEEGKYEEAAAIFLELGNYENSPEMVNVCKYTYATELLKDKDFEAAKALFEELGNYEDSANYLTECNYQQAEELFAAGNYKDALAIYEMIPDYKDSADKINEAKRELMFQQYGDVIQKLTDGVWFFNGGSDTAVNRIVFSEDKATITQIVSGGNGTSTSEGKNFSYVVDESNITLTLADGSEQVIPYSAEGDTFTLGDGNYLTPDQIEADLQGYWGIRKSEYVLGMFTCEEYIFFFDDGTLKYESASKAFGGQNGEYYYYGPYEGTYTVDENGLHADIRNNWQFSFNVIDGKAVMVRCSNVCTPVSGFKGENGFSF